MSDKLEYVLVLAEERNLTRAAKRLYISQPTLTNYINRLEQELGVKLFDRTVQPITVTPAGLIYMEDMKKIRNRMSLMQAKLELLKEEKELLTVGIPSVRSEHVIPGLLEQLLRETPGLSVNVETTVEEFLEKDLVAGRIDLAIGALSTAYPEICYECVGEMQVFLLIHRTYPCVSHLKEEEGTVDRPVLLTGDMLHGIPFLLPRVGGGQYRSAKLLMEKFGIVPGNIINCNNTNTLYQLAGNGAGAIITTPLPFMKTFPQYTDQLAFCVLQEEPVYQKTYVGYRKGNKHEKKILEMIEYLKNH